MFEVTIDDIEKNFEAILQQTGYNSFVDWQAFNKSNDEFNKTLEQLSTCITTLRQIKYKKLINTMKQLKSLDIPDLIKAVKSKRLPRQVLKIILKWFKIKDHELQLITSAEELKIESKNILENFIESNSIASSQTKETVVLVSQQITTYYLQQNKSKNNSFSYKLQFPKQKLQEAIKIIEIKQIPQNIDNFQISTYAQLLEATFDLVKDNYKRLTINARKTRHSLIKDHPNYLKDILLYFRNTEMLIIEGYIAVGGKLGLNTENLQQMERGLKQRGHAKIILDMKVNLHNNLKNQLTPYAQIQLPQLKQILKYLIEVLQSRVQFFTNLFQTMQKTPTNMDNAFKIFVMSMHDLVFEKYKIEEQDLQKYFDQSVLVSNFEVHDLLKAVTFKISYVIQKIWLAQRIMKHYQEHGSTSFSYNQMIRNIDLLQAQPSNAFKQIIQQAKK